MLHSSLHRARFGVTLALLCVFALSFGLTSAQSAPTQTRTHTETGKVTFIGTDAGNPLFVAGVSAANGPAGNADIILQRLAPDFGVRNVAQELAFTRDLVTADGRTTRRYQQMYRGIPVFGGALVMNTRADGGLLTMAGEISPDLNVDITPKFDAKRARQIAKGLIVRESGMTAKALKTTVPELVIYDERLLTPSTAPARLAYKVVVTDVNATKLSYTLLIDAKNGRTLLSYVNFDADHSHFATNNAGAAAVTAPDTLPLPEAPAGDASIAAPNVSADLGAGVPSLGGSPKINTYTANKTTNLPGTLLCNQSKTVCTNGANSDADSAHRFARDTYNYFWSILGRDSINGAGMVMMSTTDYENGSTCNAFWNGTQMVYYDRCSGGTVVLDDVVAHELTHGVTEYTASLIYAYQSGAINESVSDVFGEFVDQANGTGEDAIAFNRWKIGEPNFYIRDMKDPWIHEQPKEVYGTYWYTGTGDNGGVHYNSGVGNHMAYLMANSFGNERAARIWYEALTNILFPGANYGDLGNALVQACNNLVGYHGITSGTCSSVATHRVTTNMDAPTPVATAPSQVASLCPSGGYIYYMYEDFEVNNGQWQFGRDLGKTSWRISNQMPLDGNRSLQGRNWPSKSVAWAAMKNNIKLTPNSYLFFNHDYRFEEWDGQAYDGGFVEYTINNGATWQKLNTTATGQIYDTNVHSSNPRSSYNPMFGSYTLNGVGGTQSSSTRFDLSSLANKNVRFRWVISSDSYSGAAGWWVDNIAIYTCGITTDYSNILANTSFESSGVATLTPWVMAGASGDKVTCEEGGYIGSCLLRFRGNPGEASVVRQSINLASYPNAGGGDLFYSDGFYQSAVSGQVLSIVITITYTDNTTSSVTTPLSGGSISWRYFRASARALNKPVKSAKVEIKHHATSGYTYVDSVWLGVYGISAISFGAIDGGARMTDIPGLSGLPETPPSPTYDVGGVIPLPPPPTENQ